MSCCVIVDRIEFRSIDQWRIFGETCTEDWVRLGGEVEFEMEHAPDFNEGDMLRVEAPADASDARPASGS